MPANRELPGSPVLIRSQQEIARRLGYKLVDHRLELYGVPLEQG